MTKLAFTFHSELQFRLPLLPSRRALFLFLRTPAPAAMSSALCKPLAAATPAPRARAAASKAARVAAPAPAAAALAPRRCRSSTLCAASSVDVGSDWPANWALASFEDVGEYFNTKLLKVGLETRGYAKRRGRSENVVVELTGFFFERTLACVSPHEAPPSSPCDTPPASYCPFPRPFSLSMSPWRCRLCSRRGCGVMC